MPIQFRLLTIFVIGHIMLVAMGMAHIELPVDTTPGQLLRIYTGISGADKSYGFFAPGVRHQERAIFVLTDADGKQWQDNLEFGSSREANLRLGSTANVLRAVDDETAFHFMRSMAAKMFARHPSAQTIEVQIQAYCIKLPGGEGTVAQVDFPTMAEYRAGKRPSWIDLYSLTFQLNNAGETVAAPETAKVTP